MKYHGGFRTGDIVDVQFGGYPFEWRSGYTIVDFVFMDVKVVKNDISYTVSIHHIRKPNLRIRHGK